ncbi:MAG TPA: BolA family protein [Oleiagrimonas sp.]|nr:BolA family protein [Oleiagrimonas sp.]
MSEAVIKQIRQRLDAALAPSQLDVLDEGDQHVGHAGEGQGHYRVRIVSPAFAGKTPIQRHRLVYDAVDDLMGHGIHALAIDAKYEK